MPLGDTTYSKSPYLCSVFETHSCFTDLKKQKENEKGSIYVRSSSRYDFRILR